MISFYLPSPCSILPITMRHLHQPLTNYNITSIYKPPTTTKYNSMTSVIQVASVKHGFKSTAHHYPHPPLPSPTTTLTHHYPHPPLPSPTTTLTHHYPHPPLPSPTTTLTHHYPHPPLPSPTTTLTHHYPHPPLPSPTTTFTHHYPHPPLPSPTTTFTHHYPHPPLPSPTTTLTHHYHHLPLHRHKAKGCLGDLQNSKLQPQQQRLFQTGSRSLLLLEEPYNGACFSCLLAKALPLRLSLLISSVMFNRVTLHTRV